MTTIDQRLARKGKGQPRKAILQQARVLLQLANEHKDALAEHGWDADDSARLASNIETAEGAIGGRADSSNDAESMTRGEQAAVDGTKAYLRRLRLALPRALRAKPESGLTLASFTLDEPLRRSTPKIIAYLLKIRPAVVTLDDALKKHFAGKNASDELDVVKAALEQADTDQEAAHLSGPIETQALNESFGRLLEDVQDVVRAGRSAFDGDATMVAKFNKDLILRARRRKKGEANPEDEDGKNEPAPKSGIKTDEPTPNAGG